MHIYRLLVALLVSSPCLAQAPKPIHYRSELGSYVTDSGRLPFWLRANQYGLVPRQAPLVTFRQSLDMDYRQKPVPQPDSLRSATRRLDWGWGAEMVLNVGATTTLLLPQAYVKLKWGPGLEVWAGRRRELIGLVDSTLSSGSYAWSGNALPMTKLQIGLPDYLPRRGLFSFRGFYAHGWFESDRIITHTMLHQKALYVRLGKPHWRLKLLAGINHQVMWGGRTDRNLGAVIKNQQLPDLFSDYLAVVTARTLGNQPHLDTTRLSSFDRENRIGNHLGTVDVGLEYRGRQFSIFAYRQSIYEDGSLFYLINLSDGLNGLRIRNQRPLNAHGVQLQTLLLEYLFTQSQGGDLFLANATQRGRDNYFNHSQYQDGWSRFGQTIGTPFIPPTGDTRSDLPQYGFTNNNRVAVMHLGLAGQAYNRFMFELKASYSQNLGTYALPFAEPVGQFSSLLSLSAPVGKLKGMRAQASLASDVGDLYPNSVGFYLGLRQQGQFRKRL